MFHLFPGGLGVEVAVGGFSQPQQRFGRAAKIQRLHGGIKLIGGDDGSDRQGMAWLQGGPGGWHATVKPLAGHGGGAIEQVADGVGEIVIDQIAEALLLKIAVFAEGNIPQQIPAHRIRATAL